MSQIISRRRFLNQSLLGITAATAATYTGFPAVAQKQAGSTAANNKIGIAIIGGGSRAGGHIDYFKGDERCTILYIVDPDAKAARMTDKMVEEIAATQGGIKPQRIADMRKAFDDKSVDAITCATCNHWHALTGIWALQAGKHAYIEKPICHNIHEGLALGAAVKKYKKVIQTGTQCRSITANIDLVKFVHDGGIGEVNFARGLCYKRRKAIGALGKYDVPKTVDYDIWSGPAQIMPLTRPRFDYDWHWQRLYGNGDLGNQGPHQTDVARWLLGLDRYPNAVLSYGGRLGYDVEKNDPKYVDAGDTANTEVSIYDYGDKCIVFETRGLATPNVDIPVRKGIGTQIGVIAYGTKGYAIQGWANGQTYKNASAYDLEGNLLKEFKGGDDGAHYKNFVDAVIANDPSAVNAPAECGALSAAVSHLGNISYYLGESHKASVSEIKSALKSIRSLDENNETVDRTVEHLKANGVDINRTPMSIGPRLAFDPEAKRFIGNDEANAMLARDYRAPYIVPKPENV